MFLWCGSTYPVCGGGYVARRTEPDRAGVAPPHQYWPGGVAVLTFLCALRSGGGFNAEWVRKLRDGVARHMSLPHRFVCLTDDDVPCERILPAHDWPGWWIKAELFRPGVVTGPTVFLDLDTVIVGPLERLATVDEDYALIDLRGNGWAQLGAMFLKNPPHQVYNFMAADCSRLMRHYEKKANGQYVGDQALWKDVMGHINIPKLTDLLPGFFVSYKLHCKRGVPAGASVVCFHGKPRPGDVADPWMREAWA